MLEVRRGRCRPLKPAPAAATQKSQSSRPLTFRDSRRSLPHRAAIERAVVELVEVLDAPSAIVARRPDLRSPRRSPRGRCRRAPSRGRRRASAAHSSAIVGAIRSSASSGRMYWPRASAIPWLRAEASPTSGCVTRSRQAWRSGCSAIALRDQRRRCRRCCRRRRRRPPVGKRLRKRRVGGLAHERAPSCGTGRHRGLDSVHQAPRV